MSNVISINKVRAHGTALVWRRSRVELTVSAAYAVAEEIYELLNLPGRSALHGLVIDATDRRLVVISGRGFGPASMARSEAAELALTLARESTRHLEARRRS